MISVMTEAVWETGISVSGGWQRKGVEVLDVMQGGQTGVGNGTDAAGDTVSNIPGV